MFRALFETAPDAMIVVDADGNIVLANPQASRLFGHDVEALTGAPIEILMPASLRSRHVGHRTSFMASPRVRPMGAGQELIGLRADGEQFPVEIALSPIESEGQRYFVASIRDISETQRARQALARARYDAALAQIGQAALESAHGALLQRLPALVNEALQLDGAAVALADAQRERFRLCSVHGIPAGHGDPLEMATDEAGFEDLFSGRQPKAIDTLVDGPADSMLAALHRLGFRSLAAAPLFDLERPMGALLALSRQPHAFDGGELHFLQSVANLLAVAIQRNRTQEQLAHVQRLEAIGELTGGIAHDFNNLLTVVSGNLQLLEAELDDPSALEYVQTGLRAVGRGAELTGKLLAFARRQRLEPQSLDVPGLLRDLAGMLRPTLGANIVFELDCPPDLPRVFADPGQLENALVNLALNARDAMPRGGRMAITVRERRIEAGHGELTAGRYVAFAANDTGLGMTPDVLARAFEPFFTTKTGKGSGLGLSMVYGFVKQSGGHLTAESRLGYGTRVELLLPVADHPAALRHAADSGIETGGHETVLVVEDEPEVLAVAVAFLRSLGYAVVTAADAATAMAVLDDPAQRVDALFSDVVLGAGADGGQVARHARLRRPGLPVLLTSGYERPDGDEDAAANLEFELLRKPYRREQLARALRRALDQR